MNGVVVDASIAASWLLEDEVNETADWIIDQIQMGVQVFVPVLWLWEITNVVFMAERRKRIDTNYRDAALDRIERMPVRIVDAPIVADLRILRTYAERYQLTAYDAEYLRVAKELRLHLATKDAALITAAKSEKVPLAEKPA